MIRCIKFRAYRKNTLQGFCDFELTRVGLVLKDCALHEKNGKWWIAFPAKQFQNKDGQASWVPLIEFAAGAGEAREAFQTQAVAAVRAVADKQKSDEAA
jgi:hypothetical protein